MRWLTTTLGILGFAVGLAALHGQFQPTTPAAQMTSPVKGSGLISGQVVDANGGGVGNAVVNLNGGLQQVALTIQVAQISGGPRRALTNAEGRFVFFDLPKGAYSIDVTKPGYLAGAFGRRRFGGPAQSLDLADGERKLQLRIPIWEYASISGRIVDEVGESSVGVQVRSLSRVIWRGRPRWTVGPSATTDDRGDYRLDAIEPGEYLVVVATTPVTVPVTVIDSMVAEQASGTSTTVSQLLRSGLSSGTSFTSFTPVGEWAVMGGARGALAPTPTNDGRTFVYATTYYPGTRSLTSAQPIVVNSGEDRVGVDFPLALTPAGSVHGVVTGPAGAVPGLALQLLPDYADHLSVDTLDIAGAVTDVAGRFAMIGVPAGQYTLRAAVTPGALVGAPPAPTPHNGYWLTQPLTVTESDPPLALTMRPGVTVRGRIEFEGTSPRPGPELLQKLFAGLEPLDPNTPRAPSRYQVNFDRNGQFVIPNVQPGNYAVRYAAFLTERQAMPEWETIGGMLNGKDVSSRPISITSDLDGIVIVLTDHPSELKGTVRGADGNVDAGAAVVLFTTDRALWQTMPSFTRMVRMVRASEAGSFLMRGLIAGEYFLVAIPDEQAADWQDTRVLEQLSRDAVRIRMNYSEKKTQDLKTLAAR